MSLLTNTAGLLNLIGKKDKVYASLITLVLVLRRSMESKSALFSPISRTQ